MVFKVLEYGRHSSILAPQFTLSKTFREEEEEEVLPVPVDACQIQPCADQETGKDVLFCMASHGSPQESTQPIANVKEFRRWRVPDFALVVSRHPGKLLCFTESITLHNGNPTTFEILAPSLSAEEVIVPLIIEVKAPKSKKSSDVHRSLQEATDQLKEQAKYLFSDFGSVKEVVAIAGVGLYWQWFRIRRPENPSQDADSLYKSESPPSSDTEHSSIPLPTTPRTETGTHRPVTFIIGTEGSSEAVSDIKALVDDIVFQTLRTSEDFKNLEAFVDDLAGDAEQSPTAGKGKGRATGVGWSYEPGGSPLSGSGGDVETGEGVISSSGGEGEVDVDVDEIDVDVGDDRNKPGTSSAPSRFGKAGEVRKFEADSDEESGSGLTIPNPKRRTIRRIAPISDEE